MSGAQLPSGAKATFAAAPWAAESAASMWRRRAVSLPALAVIAVAYFLLLPLLLCGGAIVDAVGRRPWATVRCLMFFALYLVCETVGVLASFALWLASGVWAGASRRRFLAWNVALQTAWATAIYRGAERIFAMRTLVEALPCRERGPVIVFIRHVSTADTVLPVVCLTAPHGIVLRYVLKRELLWDPCLDIVGNRLPNYFVRRGSGQTDREVASVGRLAVGLGAREGVVIYPEGTRFTPEKRERALGRIATGGDPIALGRAARLRSLLPPRLAGAMGLLDANAEADALFFAHVGLEGAGSFRDLLNGSLVGATVRVRYWRVPFAEIPPSGDARVAWFHGQWRRVDEWVSATVVAQAATRHRAGGGRFRRERSSPATPPPVGPRPWRENHE